MPRTSDNPVCQLLKWLMPLNGPNSKMAANKIVTRYNGQDKYNTERVLKPGYVTTTKIAAAGGGGARGVKVTLLGKTTIMCDGLNFFNLYDIKRVWVN